MNKKIISIAIIVIIVIGVIFGLKEYQSYKNISIVFKQTLSIDLYNSSNSKITSLSSDNKRTLKTGNYYYVSKNDKFVSDKIHFTVNNDGQIIEINPDYSTSYLSSLLKNNQQSILSVISAKYPNINTNYVIADEQIYNRGDWYSARIMERIGGGNMPDVYRVVMQYKNNIWNIAISPRLIINRKDFPSVPINVINSVNGAASDSAYSSLYQ